MGHVNLSAYDGYEQFSDPEALEAYRRAKVGELDSFVEWVRETYEKPIRVLDLGSGNAKWLVRLEREGLLAAGTGIEVSESRHRFAETWIADWNLTGITPICGDLLTASFPIQVDLCLATDIVLQFLNPIREGALEATLKRVADHLKPGGRLLIDLQDLTSLKDSKTWQEFDEPDPWRFLLWEAPYNPERNTVALRKTFIGRDDNRLDRSELELEVLSLEQLTAMLVAAGFDADLETLDHHHDPTETRVVARKPTR
ncbi:MAG: class I SAM-dependent methyltransferase [Rhodothermales bacterium]|nr:class I SAM-dependent methyltransferase [Rhodothermales bacterium]